jgi:DNA-directed RNA polymerase subunit RPC12/RpoP
MISFSCPGCVKKFTVADDKAGKRTRCPVCGQAIVVPALASSPLAADRREAPPPGPVRTGPAALGEVEAPPVGERETQLSPFATSPEVQLSGQKEAPRMDVPTPPPQPEPEGRLRPCPDCRREVSRRATNCPHCGCPFGETASPFEAVFSAFVQAVRDSGYTIDSMDKQNGRIVFKSGISWTTWGMEFSCVIIDNGDGTCSCDVQYAYPGITDWGRGKKLVKQITGQALKILSDRGMPNCFR